MSVLYICISIPAEELDVALFTIARIWKQPKCPLTDEWIKKMWSIYTVEYYSVIRRNAIGSFAEM